MPPIAPAAAIDRATDPFAEGNETLTPPELWADRAVGGPDTPGWLVRAVPNLYPALVAPEGPASNDVALVPGHGMTPMFAPTPAIGAHEVIVNTPESVSSLGDLDAKQLTRAISGWRMRMREHAANDAVAYVHLSVNERPEAGASLPHSHAQLYALPFVPSTVARERDRQRAFFDAENGRQLLEDVVANEIRAGSRVIAVDDEAVLIAPYAARVPFQLMLVPRQPAAQFEAEGPLGAKLLHEGLALLKSVHGAMPPLNLWVRTAPSAEDAFCWRIDILPRIGQPAGLELGTGVYINVTPPEQAAELLRAARA